MRLILILSMLVLSAQAKLAVAVTYPYIAALTQTVGGDNVRVETLAQGNWDPHFVVPKPSLIAKVKNADLLITNGAGLEIGWLPPLLSRASNDTINNASNVLVLSRSIRLIDVPADVSRAGGDVHAEGNPHFHLDPHNIPVLAEAVSAFLSRKDPTHADAYRANLAAFKRQWSAKVAVWDSQMAPLRGKTVVQYHPVFNYFLNAYGLKTIGTIEPLAGISPSSSHTLALLALMREHKPMCILHDVYHSTKTGEYLSEKSGVRLVVLPHDVGASPSADSLAALFDTLVQGLK